MLPKNAHSILDDLTSVPKTLAELGRAMNPVHRRGLHLYLLAQHEVEGLENIEEVMQKMMPVLAGVPRSSEPLLTEEESFVALGKSNFWFTLLEYNNLYQNVPNALLLKFMFAECSAAISSLFNLYKEKKLTDLPLYQYYFVLISKAEFLATRVATLIDFMHTKQENITKEMQEIDDYLVAKFPQLLVNSLFMLYRGGQTDLASTLLNATNSYLLQMQERKPERKTYFEELRQQVLAASNPYVNPKHPPLKMIAFNSIHQYYSHKWCYPLNLKKMDFEPKQFEALDLVSHVFCELTNYFNELIFLKKKEYFTTNTKLKELTDMTVHQGMKQVITLLIKYSHTENKTPALKNDLLRMLQSVASLFEVLCPLEGSDQVDELTRDIFDLMASDLQNEIKADLKSNIHEDSALLTSPSTSTSSTSTSSTSSTAVETNTAQSIFNKHELALLEMDEVNTLALAKLRDDLTEEMKNLRAKLEQDLKDEQVGLEEEIKALRASKEAAYKAEVEAIKEAHKAAVKRENDRFSSKRGELEAEFKNKTGATKKEETALAHNLKVLTDEVNGKIKAVEAEYKQKREDQNREIKKTAQAQAKVQAEKIVSDRLEVLKENHQAWLRRENENAAHVTTLKVDLPEVLNPLMEDLKKRDFEFIVAGPYVQKRLAKIEPDCIDTLEVVVNCEFSSLPFKLREKLKLIVARDYVYETPKNSPTVILCCVSWKSPTYLDLHLQTRGFPFFCDDEGNVYDRLKQAGNYPHIFGDKTKWAEEQSKQKRDAEIRTIKEEAIKKAKDAQAREAQEQKMTPKDDAFVRNYEESAAYLTDKTVPVPAIAVQLMHYLKDKNFECIMMGNHLYKPLSGVAPLPNDGIEIVVNSNFHALPDKLKAKFTQHPHLHNYYSYKDDSFEGLGKIVLCCQPWDNSKKETSLDTYLADRDFPLDYLYCDEEGNVYDRLHVLPRENENFLRLSDDLAVRLENDKFLAFRLIHTVTSLGKVFHPTAEHVMRRSSSRAYHLPYRIWGECLESFFLNPQAVLNLDTVIHLRLIGHLFPGVEFDHPHIFLFNDTLKEFWQEQLMALQSETSGNYIRKLISLFMLVPILIAREGRLKDYDIFKESNKERLDQVIDKSLKDFLDGFETDLTPLEKKVFSAFLLTPQDKVSMSKYIHAWLLGDHTKGYLSNGPIAEFNKVHQRHLSKNVLRMYAATMAQTVVNDQRPLTLGNAFTPTKRPSNAV